MAVKSMTAQPLTPLVALLIFLSFIVLPLTASAMLQTRVVNVAPGGDIQPVVNQCLTEAAGCRIVLQANADYVAPSGGLTLPNKSGDAYISIESSRYSEIPVRAFRSLRPTATEAAMMARIRSNHPSEPVVRTISGAHHYKLLGLDIAPKIGGQAGTIVKLGDGGTAQDTLAEVPQNIIIDKSWIHAAVDQHVQRCVALNSGYTEITNNWISDCHALGMDSQAIGGWNGPGPYRIINNLLEGAGENVMFGGADPSIPGLMPSDITIQRNYFYKPLSWNFWNQANFQPLGGQAVTWSTNPNPCAAEEQRQRPPRWVDANGCVARHWTVKNLFETKNARRVLVDANLFENNWLDAQVGFAILLKADNQDNTAPQSATEDLTFSNNHVRNSDHGINLRGNDFPKLSGQTKRIRIVNSLWENINGIWFQGTDGATDILVEHNTHLQKNGNVVNLYGNPNEPRNAGVTTGLVMKNNLGPRTGFGLKGDGTGEGTAALNRWAPAAVYQGNVLAGAPAAQYPAGNLYPVTLAEAQIGADFRLAATSPFKGKATDGKDPGVDWAVFDAAMSGAPVPSPTVLPSPSPTASPRMPSPDGTKAATITDAQGGVWTIGPSQETLRNGIHMDGGRTTLYKYFGGDVYAVGQRDGKWYKWIGTWSLYKDGMTEPGVIAPTPTPTPVPTPTPAPTPTPTPSPTPSPDTLTLYEFKKFRWPTDDAGQDVVEKQAADAGWTDCYVAGNWLRCKRVKETP